MEKLLDSFNLWREYGNKPELAPDLVAIQIATVPVKVHTLTGPVFITAKMFAEEVTRVTRSVPYLVRPHRTSKLGAPYENWQGLLRIKVSSWIPVEIMEYRDKSGDD